MKHSLLYCTVGTVDVTTTPDISTKTTDGTKSNDVDTITPITADKGNHVGCSQTRYMYYQIIGKKQEELCQTDKCIGQLVVRL